MGRVVCGRRLPRSSRSRWWCGRPARRSSARATRNGCSRIATCRSSSTNGRMWSAGKCGPGSFCAPRSFSGRKGTPRTRPRRRRSRRPCRCCGCMKLSPASIWRCPFSRGRKARVSASPARCRRCVSRPWCRIGRPSKPAPRTSSGRILPRPAASNFSPAKTNRNSPGPRAGA